MGQRLSATRNASGTSHSVHTTKAISKDVYLDERDLLPFNSAPEELKTNADEISPLSSDSETSRSESNAIPEPPLVESIPKSLQYLPTELLIRIRSSLQPSSIMALNHTCRIIYHKMGDSIEQILGGIPAGPLLTRNCSVDSMRQELSHRDSRDHQYTSLPRKYLALEESKLLRAERLKFICMLEHDGHIIPSRAVCSTCVRTHDLSLFSLDSLKQHSDKRECLGRIGRMWICPHWLCGYDELWSSDRYREGHICETTRGLPNPLVTSGSKGPTIIWPLIKLGDSPAPSSSQVAEALRSLILFLCPHWRINDPFVLRHYSPDCEEMDMSSRLLRFPRVCKCNVCLWPRRDCSLCGASIFFQIMEDYDGDRALHVIVERKTFQIDRATDPVWIKQLAYPPDFEVLEQAWNASARCSEQALAPSSG